MRFIRQNVGPSGALVLLIVAVVLVYTLLVRAL